MGGWLMGLRHPAPTSIPSIAGSHGRSGTPGRRRPSKGYVAAWDTTGAGVISGIDEIWPGLSENSDVTDEMITT